MGEIEGVRAAGGRERKEGGKDGGRAAGFQVSGLHILAVRQDALHCAGIHSMPSHSQHTCLYPGICPFRVL